MNPKEELLSLKNPQKAEILSRFFKTKKGEYAEGDLFLGLTVPTTRTISKKYLTLDLLSIEKLLHDEYHEVRLLALLLLVAKYKKFPQLRNEIFSLYLKNTKYINNWDLVDLSAEHIIGFHLMNESKDLLKKLAKSNILWERRISILSTFHFIKNKKFDDAFSISFLLLNDEHDLIHKAVGWMLREIGKRDLVAEENFLKKHYKKMPRTMLRYAIERFDETKRQSYLKGKI